MKRATTAEELEAVATVAAELGIGPITPMVLSLAKHSIVKLAPLPIVARLRSTGSDRASAELAREMRIARHLAARHAPVLQPARSIDPGPHASGRCAMTLWEFTPHEAVTSADDAWLAARALRQVHEAFASFDEALPAFTGPIDACGNLMASRDHVPALREADRRFLVALHARLRSALGGCTFRAMPIHGDAHPGNAMRTYAGIVWGDFESACLGPREWDIACLPESSWPAFDTFDLDLARCLADLRSLCVAVWCWEDYGRSPRIDEAAEHHLGILRERFGHD